MSTTIAQMFAGELTKAAVCVASRVTKKLNKRESGDRYPVKSPVKANVNIGVIIRHGKHDWEGKRFTDGTTTQGKTRAEVYAKLFIL